MESNHLTQYLINIFSILLFIKGLTSCLQQKYVISSFEKMYEIFEEFPINKVNFDSKLKEACSILTSIEDKMYYKRKGYTFLSSELIVNKVKVELIDTKDKLKFISILNLICQFLRNIFSGNRGYSTIPMQLVRSLGLEKGYNCTYRRKIYEIIYSRIFFKGIEKMLEEEKVDNRENIKDYYLYIYFHIVNIELKGVPFSKFLNAFDMQYNKRNKIDIYDCSNEGIFIACMGLSRKTSYINEENIDYYISLVDGVDLNKEEILNMLSKMMDKPYNNNYLK